MLARNITEIGSPCSRVALNEYLLACGTPYFVTQHPADAVFALAAILSSTVDLNSG